MRKKKQTDKPVGIDLQMIQDELTRVSLDYVTVF